MSSLDVEAKMGAENENLEVLTTVPQEFEAELIVGELKHNGIQATSTGGFTCDFKAEAPGFVRILVKQSDLEKAIEVLEQVQDERDLREARGGEAKSAGATDPLKEDHDEPSSDAHHALVVAIVGLILFPPLLSFYSMWLLVKHDLLAGGDAGSVDWRAQAALLVNLIVILISIGVALLLLVRFA